jgi:hypothetical protein
MKCKFIKRDGNQCSGFSVTGSEYCWRHSPHISEDEKKSASALGGYNRNPVIYRILPEIIIKDTRDIPALLIDTIAHLRSGELDVRLGTAIGYLSGVLINAFILAEIETRIEKIEHFINENHKWEN